MQFTGELGNEWTVSATHSHYRGLSVVTEETQKDRSTVQVTHKETPIM